VGGVGVGGWVLFWIVFELFLSRIYCVFEACFSSSFYAPSVIRNGENKKNIYFFCRGVGTREWKNSNAVWTLSE